MSRYNPDAEASLEQETIDLLVELGWDDWADCFDETATSCEMTGRDSRQEVIRGPRLGESRSRSISISVRVWDRA